MSARDRIPPHALDAECSALGAILLSPRSIEDATVRTLTPADFYRPDHQHVFAAILRLYERGSPIDAVTVANELVAAGVVANAPELVLELQASPPAIANAGRYAAIVKAHAMRRGVIDYASRASTIAYSDDNPARAIAALRDAVAAIELASALEVEDLGPIIDVLIAGGDPGPFPSLLMRSDGQALIYPASLVSIFAPGGSGKSMLAACLASERLDAGEHVLWIDYEQSARTVAAMMLRVGAKPDLLRADGLFHYVWASGRPIGQFLALARRLRVAMVILDAMIGALGAAGIDENSNSEVRPFIDRELRPFIASPFGAPPLTLIGLDHVSGDTSDKPGSKVKPRGAIGKVDGGDLMIELSVIRPWNREQRGLMALTCRKDRFGIYALGQRMAEVDIEPFDNGASICLTPNPPSGISADGTFRPTVLMEKVSRFVENNPDASTNDIETGVTGKAGAKRLARQILTDEGYITTKQIGQKRAHRSVKAYRQESDETE